MYDDILNCTFYRKLLNNIFISHKVATGEVKIGHFQKNGKKIKPPTMLNIIEDFVSFQK